MRIKTGSKVTWSSSAGQLAGDVTDIRLDYNAAEVIVPWITVKRWDTGSLVTLCGSDSNLKMMQVKIFDMEMV